MKNIFGKYREIFFVILGLLFLLFLYYWQLFSFDPYSRTTISGDFYHFVLPNQWNIQSVLNKGWLPFWDALLQNGYPIIAEAQHQLFYPPNILRILLFLPANLFKTLYSLELIQILHVFILGLGTYLLIRTRMKCSVFASFFGGVAVMFGGFISLRTAVGHTAMVQALSWLPWLMLIYEGFYTKGGRKFFLLSVVVTYLSIAAGYIPMTIYSIGISIFYVLSLHFEGFKPTVKKFLPLFLAIVLAVGIAGPILIPQVEYSRLTYRVLSTDKYESAMAYSAEPSDILKNVIYPFSLPIESYAYPGIIPILLFLILLFARRFGKKEIFFLSLFVVSVLSSFGKELASFFAPLYYWPTLTLDHTPSRLLFFSSFALVILASLSLDSLERNKLAFLQAAEKIKKALGYFLFPVLILFFFFVIFQGLNAYNQQWNIVQQIFNNFAGMVIFTFLSLYLISLFPSRNGNKVLKIGLILLLATNLAIVNNKQYPLPKFTEIASHLPNATSQEMKNLPYGKGPRGDYDYKIEDFYYPALYEEKPSITASLPLNLEKMWILVRRLNNTVNTAAGGVVFANASSKNNYRWWIVTGCIFRKDNNQILSDLTNQKTDVKTNIILLKKDEEAARNYCNNNAVSYKIKLDKLENNKTQLTYETNSKSIMYVSDVFYSGWVAKIDNNPVSIFNANYAFEAVPLEKGKHILYLEYKPKSLIIGFYVLVMSFILILVFYFFWEKFIKILK